MKKIIVSTFAMAMLASSSVIADSKLSAFQGVETHAVAAAELSQVSGEGLLGNLLGLGSGLLGDVLSGNLVGSVVGTVLGTATNLKLLEGLTVDSGTAVNTGALVGGLTGIQSVGLGISVQ